MRYFIFIIGLFFLTNCSSNQPTEGKLIFKDSLIEYSLETKYFLDTSMIHIYAYDIHNKLLWKTDPWKDNNLMVYRNARPKVIYFQFLKDERTNNNEVIGVGYNNSQFGYLDKLTGKFTFLGQD